MEIKKLKNAVADFKTSSRWVEVKHDFEPGKRVSFRVIGIGTKRVKVMSNSGTTFNVTLEDIIRAW
jgi:hypothetical protein